MSSDYETVHRALLHIPIVTTCFAVFFATVLFTRYRKKGGGPHLLWWGVGMVTYGIGTFTEAYTTLFGWHPVIFRCWYIAGAFLGGYPLAQGSIYLLMKRRFANASAWIVCSLIGVASILVFLTPLDPSLAEAHRLHGDPIVWSWLRKVSIPLNTYALIFLAGGAFVSALRFKRMSQLRNRYLGNIMICIGAILPGIGGSMTRLGYVEVLYVTELMGLLLIFAGYKKCVATPAAPAPAAATAQ